MKQIDGEPLHSLTEFEAPRPVDALTGCLTKCDFARMDQIIADLIVDLSEMGELDYHHNFAGYGDALDQLYEAARRISDAWKASDKRYGLAETAC